MSWPAVCFRAGDRAQVCICTYTHTHTRDSSSNFQFVVAPFNWLAPAAVVVLGFYPQHAVGLIIIYSWAQKGDSPMLPLLLLLLMMIVMVIKKASLRTSKCRV